MPRILTVGHSNHPLETFLEILRAHGIARVLDVRRYPASRRWPHFGAAELARSLAAAGMEYDGLPELGGRRRPRPDSPHTAWREAAFRGYADFMDTPEFAAGLAKVEERGGGKTSALLCAEAVPWRCHRSLIADALVARGWEVEDVVSASSSRPHALPPFARKEGMRLVYDAGDLPFS
ncbi:MAG TPA: DUF488 domain-containing protein [Thermoanaerobaculia bacterium]